MSFRLKTILGIALIEVCLLSVLVISGLYYLRSSGETELMKRGKVTSQLIATMTGDAVVSLDLATLDALVAQTLENNGVVYVRVRSNGGFILSEGGDEGVLAQPFLEDVSIKAAMADGRLDVAAPIVVAGETFGQVEIGLATEQLENAVAEAQQWMLTIAGSEIILVAFFGLLLGTMLTAQLKRLQAGAQRVACGEFGYQLKVLGHDELADTASSFNQMSEALAHFAQEAEAARLKAEAGQAYAETVLNDALNSMRESVIVVSPDMQATFINESYRARYDLEVREDGENGFEYIAMLALAQTVELGEDGKEVSLEERLARLRNPEAYPRWRSKLADGSVILTTQRRMSDGGVVVVEHDVTELYIALERNRQLELELMQTHKMEALGIMAGGIAHEINTPLQFIGDNLKFVAESFDLVRSLVTFVSQQTGERFAPVRQKLEEIDWNFIEQETPIALEDARTGVKAVSKIVRSVKEFAHPERGEKSHQDLNALIDNVLTVSRNQWSMHADVSLSTEGGVGAVSCFPGQLSQVLINLIVNAAQAIEGQERADKGKITVSASAGDGQAVITVSDDGPGIPAENHEKIFEMFYTTKAPGEGTGQGLAICKQIIEGTHGGHLSVVSREGIGTTFSITIPSVAPLRKVC